MTFVINENMAENEVRMAYPLLGMSYPMARKSFLFPKMANTDVRMRNTGIRIRNTGDRMRHLDIRRRDIGAGMWNTDILQQYFFSLLRFKRPAWNSSTIIFRFVGHEARGWIHRFF